MTPSLRLAELVAALSIATDLGTGHPVERSLRACLLSVHLGDALGFDDQVLYDAYYVALLRFAGCTSSKHRSNLFGDEIALGTEIDTVELWRPMPMLRFIWQHVGENEPPVRRAIQVTNTLLTGIQKSAEAAVAHCEVSQRIANRLGLGESVHQGLGQIFERWDGKGIPGTAQGEALTPAARLVSIAHDAELFYRLGGVEAAVAVLRQRSGGQYDPLMVEQFCRRASSLLSAIDSDSVWEKVLASEPGTLAYLTEPQLEEALATLGDFTDLRSTYTLGHSAAVAELAEAAALSCRLPQAEITTLRRAGLIHDIGKTAISVSIWEKAGTLNQSEWERVRLHPYYTERIFARSKGLASLGTLAALHHERLDGSGYHRCVPASLISPAARILSAANFYRARTETRPYRPAFTPEQAADELRREVHAGRLDGDAANAVLNAAGHRVSKAQHVAGLSERELEVLRLIAKGYSKKQVAAQLVLSTRTVDHHVRHIYDKLGVSTRAAAALFAMQHHLLEE